MNNCYVYIIKKDIAIIYIGKGAGSRVETSLQQHQGTHYLILADGLTSYQALAVEKWAIWTFQPPNNRAGKHLHFPKTKCDTHLFKPYYRDAIRA
jgi:hypothetical protein